MPTEQYAYSLITSYEDFHFAKPRLEYYAEILAYLGIPPHQAAMIGNDPTDDLLPAQSLGLAVFDVNHDSGSFPGGDLLEAAAWIDQAHQEARQEAASQPEAILARLRAHLSALHTILPPLDERQWTLPPQKGEWAINQILCHLRDVEHEVYLTRMHSLLTEQNPHISAIETDRWAEERDYSRQSGEEAFNAYSQSRLELLKQLDSLTDEQWKLPARHSIFGPTTLAEIYKIATDHDLLHLAQIRSNLVSLQTE